MAFWIFKCNPKMYKLTERLADARSNPTISWRVTQKAFRDRISPGDTAFIMETGDAGGICAVMRIDTPASEMVELETEKKYCIDLDSGLHWMVKGTLVERNLSLSRNTLRATLGLENLSVFSPKVFQMATNFEVSPEEGLIILKAIGP